MTIELREFVAWMLAALFVGFAAGSRLGFREMVKLIRQMMRDVVREQVREEVEQSLRPPAPALELVDDDVRVEGDRPWCDSQLTLDAREGGGFALCELREGHPGEHRRGRYRW